MLDAELKPVFSFYPDFNEVIISDSERRQQIHNCSSKGACNTADWVTMSLAAAKLIVHGRNERDWRKFLTASG
jgi:hypothetical protein